MSMNVDRGLFIDNFLLSVDRVHLIEGGVKAAIFGLTVSLIGCCQGYHASGGGRGVGLAATRAVVFASVSLLILDYFITDFFMPFMPTLE
jgi:phospholipid/cholesterol/gamma-HCH transport system permease protein